jgi:hypothetical protein
VSNLRNCYYVLLRVCAVFRLHGVTIYLFIDNYMYVTVNTGFPLGYPECLVTRTNSPTRTDGTAKGLVYSQMARNYA